MKSINLDHVERLSRGKRSGVNIGSRAVGHHLRPHERHQYQRALSKGYLDITIKDRDNLWHIWEKACIALDQPFLVLVKQADKALATIYVDNALLEQLPLADAKSRIKALADS